MDTRANLLQVTPFMHVPDLTAALHFFVDILGFHLDFHSEGYAYVEREAAGFRLMEDKTVDPTYKERYAYYIDVRDVDALYAELKPRLDTLPDREHHAPRDQRWHQREVVICAPDGYLLAFGQDIRHKPEAERTYNSKAATT